MKINLVISLYLRRLLPTLLSAMVLFCFWANPALALVDVVNSFSPINVLPGQTSTYTIILNNSNFDAATGTALSYTLTTNVTALSVSSNNCGTVSIADPTKIVLSDGTIPAAVGAVQGSCTIQVLVSPSVSGTYINTISVGAVTSSQGSNTQATSATLTVPAVQNLTATKAVTAAALHVTGTTTLTFTLINPNNSPLTNATFTDDFTSPTATPLLIAGTTYNDTSAPVTGGSCVGKSFTNKTDGALAVGDSGFKVTGVTIPANSSCTVTVSVKLPPSQANLVKGSFTNTIPINGITTNEGARNIAAVTRAITVQTGAEIVKGFAPATIFLNSTSTLTLTLNNYNLTAITGASFTDTLPSGVSAVSLVSNTCGGSVTLSPDSQISLSGATIPAAGSATTSTFGTCAVRVRVRGTSTGSKVNTTGNISADFGGVAYGLTPATLTVQASPVTITKAFSPSTVVQGNTTTLTINLVNANGNNAAINSFTDLLSTMGTGNNAFTIVNPGNIVNTCGGYLTNNSNSPIASGDNSVVLHEGSLSQVGSLATSCKIQFDVQTPATATSGNKGNVIAANALTMDQGIKNATATTTNLLITTTAPEVTLNKSFNPITANGGAPVTLRVEIYNTATGAIALSGVSLTDILPAGVEVHSIPGPTTSNCGAGATITAVPGSGTIALSGASIAANGTCVFTVKVAGTVDGNHPNTLGIGVMTSALPAG